MQLESLSCLKSTATSSTFCWSRSRAFMNLLKLPLSVCFGSTLISETMKFSSVWRSRAYLYSVASRGIEEKYDKTKLWDEMSEMGPWTMNGWKTLSFTLVDWSVESSPCRLRRGGRTELDRASATRKREPSWRDCAGRRTGNSIARRRLRWTTRRCRRRWGEPRPVDHRCRCPRRLRPNRIRSSTSDGRGHEAPIVKCLILLFFIGNTQWSTGLDSLPSKIGTLNQIWERLSLQSTNNNYTCIHWIKK